MRYTPEHVEATRARVLEASARQFREHGFDGVGVDGLARAAKVTSGAFYNHFGSKASAFAAVVAAGVARVGEAMAYARRTYGSNWLQAAAAYYLGAEHRQDVAGGCALPSLSAAVSRADEATRKAYETEIIKVAQLIAEGLPDSPDRTAAWPILAQLAGGVLLSRAVYDEALAQEISEAVLAAIPPSDAGAGAGG
jgi:TetR/AcrR family transcriptional repressor of nem operon